MKQLSSTALSRGELVSCSGRLHAVCHILNLQHTSLNMPMLQIKDYLQNNFFSPFAKLCSTRKLGLRWQQHINCFLRQDVFAHKGKLAPIIPLALTHGQSKIVNYLAKQII